MSIVIFKRKTGDASFDATLSKVAPLFEALYKNSLVLDLEQLLEILDVDFDQRRQFQLLYGRWYAECVIHTPKYTPEEIEHLLATKYDYLATMAFSIHQDIKYRITKLEGEEND